VLVEWTYLEQTAPPDFVSVPEQRAPVLSLRLDPSPDLARRLYRDVGAPHGWSSRLDWGLDDWSVALAKGEFWIAGSPTRPRGFCELTAEGSEVTIKYLGLLPPFQGKGLGSLMVRESVRNAWSVHRRSTEVPKVTRVLVDTTSRDSPRALELYRRNGFQVIRTDLHRATVARST